MRQKIISISINPNFEKDDFKIIKKTILNFKEYKTGKYLQEIKKIFKKNYKDFEVFLFLTARAGIYSTLKSLKKISPNKKNEVIIQGFSCVALPEAIISAGLKPVYADIENDFNISLKDLKNKISQKTLAIIVQHTFGIPAKIEKIKKLAEKYNVLILEDCAHILDFKNKNIAKFSDILIFSFGRDKTISSIFGGAILINKKQKKLLEILKKEYKNLKFPSCIFILRALLQPLFYEFIINYYNFLKIGWIFSKILNILRITPKAVFDCEKKGILPKFLIKKYPNAFAKILFNQLKKIEKMNSHRIKISQVYLQEFKSCLPEKIPYLRFPLIAKKPSKILNYFKNKSIYLGDWYKEGISPKGVDFQKINYNINKLKNIKQISRKIINLPTNIRIEKIQAKLISQYIMRHYKNELSNKRSKK